MIKKLFLFAFLFTATAMGQTKDVPLFWDANPVDDDLIEYTVKRSGISGGPYVFVATVPVVDPLAVPEYTDLGVDFTGDVNYYYVVSATNVLAESGDSVELRVKLPQIPKKAKIKRN